MRKNKNCTSKFCQTNEEELVGSGLVFLHYCFFFMVGKSFIGNLRLSLCEIYICNNEIFINGGKY